MKYAIIQCSNGHFSIVSEWDDDINNAIVNFHSTCMNLWNATDVQKATVQIVDEKFIPHKTEYIKYDA